MLMKVLITISEQSRSNTYNTMNTIYLLKAIHLLSVNKYDKKLQSWALVNSIAKSILQTYAT